MLDKSLIMIIIMQMMMIIMIVLIVMNIIMMIIKLKRPSATKSQTQKQTDAPQPIIMLIPRTRLVGTGPIADVDQLPICALDGCAEGIYRA